MPNITGVVTSLLINEGRIASGAMSIFNWGTTGVQGTYTHARTADIGFDASLSNAIYGASDTVQPKSVTVLYFIKY